MDRFSYICRYFINFSAFLLLVMEFLWSHTAFSSPATFGRPFIDLKPFESYVYRFEGLADELLPLLVHEASKHF